MTRPNTILFYLLIVPALLAYPAGFQTNTFSFGSGPALAGELTPIYPGYPEVFDVSGSVEHLENDTLVVNDASFLLPSSATYHSPNGAVGKSAISKGSEVGLILTDDKRIDSVWLLKKGGASKQNATESKSRIPYKTEDGVWRN